ncbi:mechanosensitive ion channel domain-containing protein [Aliidiomarina quisquiliarum]|uniref:mechanosensitive ion channel domain-containing protein n=1 Tax=Aliidiomarina quisquiliarum TaxID=2938947 RepID=UPI00208EE91B|nr:mechanosensitive ion channel domain-containing protein [Aliidiomarina quisquiliarum]MCO4321585.1 mechanosensitive ion channel [Aliidiomarina quisquiliarum]
MENILVWIGDNQELILRLGIKLIVSLLILIGGIVLARFTANFLIRRLDNSAIDNMVVSFLASIIRALIIIAAVLMALSHVGVQTTSFIAILGAAGLAIGLALQGSLSNFASGVMIMIYRPFKAGDYVDAGGIAGSVQRIELFTTVLKTPDNKKVVVPNSRITTSAITNFSVEATRRVDLVIGVSYNANLQDTKKLFLDILMADERVLKTPEPTIAVSELGDSAVKFIVRPWVNRADYWAVYWGCLEKFKDALDAAGIGIPYPQMDVHLHTKENPKLESKD